MNRILVTGARGQLGMELQTHQKRLKGTEFYFYDIEELDICNKIEVENTINKIKPDLLINCAAYTAVDRAEENADNAYAVNAVAVRNIVNAASGITGMKLIHISTDFVFDGKNNSPYNEDDSPNPQSVYGISKLQGEKYALTYPHTMIIRTSWLYSEYGSNFVKTILRLAGENEEINVINDQRGTPTWTTDLASSVLNIWSQIFYEKKKFIPGIYHYSNEGSCSWYEFACEIARIAELNIKINPVSTTEFPLPAKRPPYSVLGLDKIKNTYDIKIPSWQESLEIFLNRYK